VSVRIGGVNGTDIALQLLTLVMFLEGNNDNRKERDAPGKWSITESSRQSTPSSNLKKMQGRFQSDLSKAADFAEDIGR